MLIARRLLGYVVLFFLVLLVSILWLDFFWRPLDHVVYKALYAEEASLHRDILLIDVPHRGGASTDQSLKEYRERIADLLDQIAPANGAGPDAVVLDIIFQTHEVGIEALKSAIAAAEESGVPVFLSLDTLGGASDELAHDKVMERHRAELYAQDWDRVAHTIFDANIGVLTYKKEISLKQSDGTRQNVEAMPVRVAKVLQRFTNDRSGYVLALGSKDKVPKQTWSYLHAEGTTGGRFTDPRTAEDERDLAERQLPSLKNKFVVIGSVIEDVDTSGRSKRPGPELVVWSLSDQLSKPVALTPLDNTAGMLAQIITLGFLTAFVYALLFQYVKRLQTRPVVITLISILVNLILLVVFSGIMLQGNVVIPVGMTLVSIVLAGGISAMFAHKFLVTGVAEGSGKYDVFISYSHRHKDWVVENVYEPLQAAQKPDGSRLSIFFDRDSIPWGDAFTAKYMWAIVDSTHFLPVFSEDYYGKNHCRNEMDVAYKRYVEKRLTVLPIVHGAEVPEIYNHLNYIDVDANPEFIESIAQTWTRSGDAPDAS